MSRTPCSSRAGTVMSKSSKDTTPRRKRGSRRRIALPICSKKPSTRCRLSIARSKQRWTTDLFNTREQDMLRLDIDRPDGQSGIRSRIGNIYERIAGNDDYQRNEKSLQLIQVCVITISAGATGFVNAFAHRERLGWVGASLLAILITGFVEKFYFALRHGLTTIYKTRKQRFVAWLSYRAIQLSMALNAAILCAWVVGSTLPEPLRIYNKWTIALHFTLALVGVSAVRDADAVVEDRIRKLKAEAIDEDIVTIRRAAINDNPLVLAAAKVRGFLDGWSLALQLIRDKPDFSANDVNKQLADHSPRLCLPSAGESTVTDISGKTPAPVNAALELDVPLQSQANSPVQNNRPETRVSGGAESEKQPTRSSTMGGQSNGVGSEEAGKQLGSDDQIKQSSRTTGSKPNRVGEYDETGEQPCSAQANEDIRMGGQVIGKGIGKPRKKGGQPLSDNGLNTNGNEGGQLAQVIMLSPSHTNPRLWVG